jgi:hypothetical protein
VRLLGYEVVGVKPRPEFAPFFRLNYERWRKEEHPGEHAGVLADVAGSGSDGIRYRIRYTPGLGPGYQPCVVRSDRIPRPRRADAMLGVALAGGSPGSLRQKARRLGVSHEAVRQAMIAAGAPSDLETRNARIRELAARGVPWPAIAQAFGISPSGVRFVCRDLPPRPSGRRPRGDAAADAPQ